MSPEHQRPVPTATEHQGSSCGQAAVAAAQNVAVLGAQPAAGLHRGRSSHPTAPAAVDLEEEDPGAC